MLWRNDPAKDLLYADTEIERIEVVGSRVDVRARGYDGKVQVAVRFLGASVVADRSIENARVECGQIVNLKNGHRRLFLFDDDYLIILEIEYRDAESVS